MNQHHHTFLRFASFLAILWLLAHAARLVGAQIPQLQSDRQSLEHWEGVRSRPYRDKNAWCVGIGHSLTAHFEPVKSLYSTAEIEAFYSSDYADTLRIARKSVKDFDGLPTAARMVIVNVIWTVGPTGFMKLRSFRAALSRRDYWLAASYLQKTKWRADVGVDRSEWAIQTLRTQQ
jgi:GH24 family phage-related lysozyme (muramidase)